jgi:hypothetical protein
LFGNHSVSKTAKSKSLSLTGLSVLLGAGGGALCGAAILVFGGLIGRSGTTGTEHIGYWEPALVFLGFMYGAFFGAFAGLLAYPFAVRKIGIQRAIAPGFVGTLAGGFVGAVAGPPLAVLTGIMGFFAALYWAQSRYSSAPPNQQNGNTY